MKRIPESIWTEIRTAYASGIGLREMARNMDIPEGTVLALSKTRTMVTTPRQCQSPCQARGGSKRNHSVRSRERVHAATRRASPRPHGEHCRKDAAPR